MKWAALMLAVTVAASAQTPCKKGEVMGSSQGPNMKCVKGKWVADGGYSPLPLIKAADAPIAFGLTGDAVSTTTVAAGWWGGAFDHNLHISIEDIKVILVVAKYVVDPSVHYAVMCTESNPNCGVAYKSEEQYLPFASTEDALAYLNRDKDVTFLRMMEVKTIPVETKNQEKTVPQPPVVQKSTIYSLKK